MYDDDLELHATLGRNVLFWAILIGAIIIGSTFVHYWLKPVWLGYERDAFVESHQYVEARRAEIISNMAKYDELTVEIAKYELSDNDNSSIISGLRAQQRSLANMISSALHKIPKESWPSGSERFMPGPGQCISPC